MRKLTLALAVLTLAALLLGPALPARAMPPALSVFYAGPEGSLKTALGLTGLRCVDAFAGTGALGLEAASRGASEVVLVEQEAHLVRALSKITTQLKASAVRVERGDGVSALRQRRGQAWDLVFIDPPFGEDGSAALFQSALEAARQAIHSEGEIYLEAPVVWTDEALAPLGLCVHRQSKAGAVAFHLLRPLAST